MAPVVLSFPADRSIGQLESRPKVSEGDVVWTPVSDAVGQFDVDETLAYRLTVQDATATDLAFLDTMNGQLLNELVLPSVECTEVVLGRLETLTALQRLVVTGETPQIDIDALTETLPRNHYRGITPRVCGYGIEGTGHGKDPGVWIEFHRTDINPYLDRSGGW